MSFHTSDSLVVRTSSRSRSELPDLISGCGPCHKGHPGSGFGRSCRRLRSRKVGPEPRLPSCLAILLTRSSETLRICARSSAPAPAPVNRHRSSCKDGYSAACRSGSQFGFIAKFLNRHLVSGDRTWNHFHPQFSAVPSASDPSLVAPSSPPMHFNSRSTVRHRFSNCTV